MQMTEEVIKTRNSLMIITVVMGVICMALGLFFAENIFKWILGIAIGVLICIFRIFSMTKSLSKAVEMEPTDAKNYARVQYMLRYILTFAFAVVACYLGFASPVGVIVGLILLQPAVYIYNFIDSKKAKS